MNDATHGEAMWYPVVLDAALCTNCGNCLNACPTGVFERAGNKAGEGGDEKPRAVHAKDCHVCFLCVPDCPSGAITVSWDAPNPRQVSVYDQLGIDLREYAAASSGAVSANGD